MSKPKVSKYEELANHIPELVGGLENVSFFTHCVTRLRFSIKDKSRVDVEKIKKVSGVLGCQWSGEQLQIVIGQAVDEAYQLICQKTGLASGQPASNEPTEKKRPKLSLMALADVISGCITPVVSVLIGAGMIKVVMLVCEMLGVIQADGPTYVTLNFVADAAFYFLPVYAGAAAAKKFNMNTYIGMFLGAMLLHPTFVTMCSEGAAGSVFGIPIYAGTYTNSVFPVIITVYVASYVERFFKKHAPSFLRSMLVPFGTILVMTPLSLCVLSPIGSVIGTYLANAIIWIYETGGFIGVALLATIHPLMVMTGMHHGMGPYLFSSFATVGYEPLASPATFIDNINIGAACLAVGIKSKVTDIKTEAMSCGITATVSGVTEPGLFGIVLKYRKTLYTVMIGNLLGGLIAGLTKSVCYAFAGSYGFFGLATFIGEKGLSNLYYIIIAVAAGFILTFVLTFIVYKDDSGETVESVDLPVQDTVIAENERMIAAPISGEVKALAECPDQVFASGTLGQGVVIEPSEGKVYAPCNGEIVTIFDTLHAIGIQSEHGAEVLIHVGMDTVALQGKGFQAHRKTGDKIKTGDLLLEFDMDFIRSQGKPVTTPVIVSNFTEFPEFSVELGNVTHGDMVIRL